MAYKSLKDVAKVFVAEYDVRPVLGAPMVIKRTAAVSEFRQPGESWGLPRECHERREDTA